MFLCALQDDGNFDITAYINEEFFSELWLYLVRNHYGRVGDAKARRRTFISQYV